MAERYRISYRETEGGPLQLAFRDTFDEVVDWIAANGDSLKQIFVVREEGIWKRPK